MKTLFRILGVFLLAVSAVANAAPVLTVSLPPGQVTQGDSFTASIDVSGAIDLYGYQFDLLYDPALIDVLGITEGAFLGAGGPTMFIPGDIDKQLGAIALNANTLLGPVTGVDGAGSLLLVQMKALAPGMASFSLANGLLVDSGLTLIAFSSGAVAIQIAEGGPVPLSEPQGWLLVLPLALALAGVDRRRTAEARRR